MASGRRASHLIISIQSTPSHHVCRCFPAISGFRVSWDSRKPSGQRVQRIWLLEDSQKLGPDNKLILVDKEEIFRTSNRELVLLTGQFMSLGGDGYDCLANKKVLISSEGGQPKSAVVRTSLLGGRSISFWFPITHQDLHTRPQLHQTGTSQEA